MDRMDDEAIEDDALPSGVLLLVVGALTGAVGSSFMNGLSTTDISLRSATLKPIGGGRMGTDGGG